MKPIKIGNVTIPPVEMDGSITKAVDKLNELYDKGDLKSVLITYTTSESAGAVCAGDFIHRAMLAVTAAEMSMLVLDEMKRVMFGDYEQDEEGEDDC